MNVLNDEVAKVLINMPFDFEINGRIYYQAVEILGNNFFLINDEKTRGLFCSVILDVMLKLEAMKYHRNNFRHIEEHHLAIIKEESSVKDACFRKTYQLLFELESFLFQLKSSLDLTVKIIGVLIPGKFRVQTFEQKGGKLILGLENYLRDKNCKAQYAKDLIDMLKGDKEAWLEQAIALRDKIAHYRTFSEFNYQYTKFNGKESLNYPKIAGMQPLEYIDLMYKNCIEFTQDFMCLSIGLYFPEKLDVGLKREEIPAHVGEPLGQYIKFGLGIAE